MKLEDIKVVCKAHPELPRILTDAFGYEIPLGKLSLEPNGIIDTNLLREILEEYRRISGTNAIYDNPERIEKTIPSLFIIWKDGTVEKTKQIAYRCVGTTYDDWSGDITHSGEIGWEDNETQPIAQHFVSRKDVWYIVKLEKCTGGWLGEKEKINSLTITLFFPSPDLDIQATAQAIMTSFEECGHTDYFDRDMNE